MYYNGTKTIYNIKLVNKMLAGIPFKPLPNTTLNEKFDINFKYKIADNEYPKLNLLVIGSTDTIINPNDSELMSRLSPHKVTDGALFNHIPFYMRKLSETETYPPSNKLRLKKIINYKGEEYLVYYGYAINEYEYKDDVIIYSNINTDYVSVSKYNTSNDNILFPEPSSNLNMTNDRSTYITDFFKIYIFFTKEELNEIKNAIYVMYGDNVNNVKINELGVASSIEVKVNDEYKECLYAQMNYFIDTFMEFDKHLTDTAIDFYIEVGGMEILTQ